MNKINNFKTCTCTHTHTHANVQKKMLFFYLNQEFFFVCVYAHETQMKHVFRPFVQFIPFFFLWKKTRLISIYWVELRGIWGYYWKNIVVMGDNDKLAIKTIIDSLFSENSVYHRHSTRLNDGLLVALVSLLFHS